jgi:hypothetical protein
MGLADRIFGRRDRRQSGQSGRPARIEFSVAMETSPLVKVSGTTTMAASAVEALVKRHATGERALLELESKLVREPDNPVDPLAVAIWVEGERVGYLPGYLAKSLPLDVGEAWPVPLQLFSVVQDRGIRGEAWVWLGEGPPRWAYSATNPPPLTTEEKRAAEHRARSKMVRRSIAEGGARAQEFRTGMVNGVHYLELVEPIKQLKREGKLREALVLCYGAIEAAERDADGREPAPWYTEQAAIVHRKLGERDEEIAVLRRWIEFAPANRRRGRIPDRLSKLLGSS